MTVELSQKIIRRAGERGRTKIDWLESYHTFSFGEYHDPAYMGFSTLRVINDDIVAPGGGFDTHPHRDMEIVSVILSGQLQHKDSMGNGSVIQLGDVQRMSAGTGVQHSEFNPSSTEPVHLLQIWIRPAAKGQPPEYEQKNFADADQKNRWLLVGSQDGRGESVTIHQDVSLYMSVLDEKQKLEYVAQPERSIWIHVATGSIVINDEIFSAGDALGITKPCESLLFEGLEKQSRIILFDLQQGRA